MRRLPRSFAFTLLLFLMSLDLAIAQDAPNLRYIPFQDMGFFDPSTIYVQTQIDETSVVGFEYGLESGCDRRSFCDIAGYYKYAISTDLKDILVSVLDGRAEVVSVRYADVAYFIYSACQLHCAPSYVVVFRGADLYYIYTSFSTNRAETMEELTKSADSLLEPNGR